MIGQIVEVKEDVGRRGRGRDKPYVFINFGPWRGSIVKISIWSEGLAKLKEKPSKNWIGRWVSVTGLLDPPYHSKRYGYTHLSVTVQEDGQIQTLDESQARFRLGKSITQPARGAGAPGRTAPVPPHFGRTPPNATKSAKTGSTGGTRNKDILKKYGTRQPPTPPTHTRTSPPIFTPQKSAQQSGGVPLWVWIAGALIFAIWLLSNTNGSKQSGQTSVLPAQTSPAGPSQSPGPRDVARLPDASVKPAPVPYTFPRPQSPAVPAETGRNSIPAPRSTETVPPNKVLPPATPAPNVAVPLPPPVEVKPADPSTAGPNETGSLGNAPDKLLDTKRSSDVQLLQGRLLDLRI